MRVGIYDSDTYVLKRICEILQEKCKEDVEFKTLERSEIMMNKYNNIDMLIFPKDMIREAEKSKIIYMLLTEDEEDINKDLELYIYKYSNVNEYLKSIKDFYKKQTLYNINYDTKIKAKLITFLSLGGGMGSSVLAAALARFLCEDREVLYVNLKPFTSSGYLSVEQNNITIKELIHDIENKSGNLNTIIDSIKKDRSGVSVLNNFRDFNDLCSMTGEQIKKLIRSLDKLSKYAYIIFDINMSGLEYLYEIMDESGSICLTVDDSSLGSERLKNTLLYLEQLNKEFSHKIKVICNKSNVITKHNKDIQEKIIGTIEKYENCSEYNIVEKISDMKLFNKL